ncbi:acyltransferase family protein [Micrococcaceae bacterium RIT802]|nr:acyltransferase family protein [Micrococcaceae bacterium RIT 802]
MSETASKPRDPRLDIAKGVLITLVVAGHLLEAMNHWSAETVRLPLTFIYAFHMPAFVFLTGITAKPHGIFRRIRALVILLVIFQLGYFLAARWLDPDATFSWHTPYWILWFLLALIWWLMLTPLIARFPRAAVGLSLAVAVSASAVPWVGYPLAIGRTLTFLPFFVVGFLYGKTILAWCGKARGALRGWTVAVALVLPALLYAMHVDNGWLYGSMSASDLDEGTTPGLLTRAALMLVAALVTAGFLMVLPKSPGIPWAVVGQRSLAVFLFHGVLVKAVNPYLPQILAENNVMSLVLVAVVTAGTVALTSWQPINEAVRRIGAPAPRPAAPERPADVREKQLSR